MTADNPRRFYIQRDNSTGRWDALDALTDTYLVCDVSRTAAERAVERARWLRAMRSGPHMGR